MQISLQVHFVIHTHIHVYMYVCVCVQPYIYMCIYIYYIHIHPVLKYRDTINNNNIYLLQMGCHPVAVITLHVFPNTDNAIDTFNVM
jgi:hypothetical protein